METGSRLIVRDWISGRRILVTGAHGFLGSVVCRNLVELAVGELITPTHQEADLTRQDVVGGLLAAVRPDVVIHLAAEVGGIGANREHPGRYFYANMAMGLHLIEASRLAGVGKFVQVGTVCAYPKHTPVPFKEDDLWNGYPEETNAPYGIAKKSLLVMLQAYRKQYGFNGIYLLPVNLYGPGDNFDPVTSHVIPALIRKFVEARDEGSQEVKVWGSGQPSREFLYVDDAARAIVHAAQRVEHAEPINLGSGVEVSIADLARMIADLVGFRGEIRHDLSYPDGQPRRRLDVSRAERELGFRAEVSLNEGLMRTIRWWEREHRI